MSRCSLFAIFSFGEKLPLVMNSLYKFTNSLDSDQDGSENMTISVDSSLILEWREIKGEEKVGKMRLEQGGRKSGEAPGSTVLLKVTSRMCAWGLTFSRGYEFFVTNSTDKRYKGNHYKNVNRLWTITLAEEKLI